MAIFRKGTEPYRLAVMMTGIKMGDRLLLLGCGDGGLFAALGAKVGLTGTACAFDDNEAAATRARKAAEKAGVLAEVQRARYDRLPYEDQSFDLVVARDVLPSMLPEVRVGCLREALRVLRPGGRIVAIEPTRRGGLGAFFTDRSVDPYYRSSGGAECAFRTEGFVAVRTLAEREGLTFVEGVKSRQH